MQRLKVAHPGRCIGCYSCMFACSRNIFNTVSLRKSAIKIKTSGGIESDFIVVVCHACRDAPCARACKYGALKIKGRVRVDREKCNGCGDCIEACLMGAIALDQDNKVIKCIHCGYCAKFCPHDVLRLEKMEAL